MLVEQFVNCSNHIFAGIKNALFILLLVPFCGFAQLDDHFSERDKTHKKNVPDTRSTEIGVFGGVSYYNGEVNPASQFNPAITDWAAGILLRRNVSSRWCVRLNGMYGNFKGNDNIGTSPNQLNRGLAFQSKVYEVSGMVEFNFIPYCVANDIIYFTPYLFWGLGGFHFNTVSLSSDGTTGVELATQKTEGVSYSKTSMCMPFGIGLKPKLSNRFLLGIEWGMRKTWTDYIDDVSTVYPTSGKQRGNSQTKDFYSFAGISLTVRLGPKLTSCHFGQ